MHTRLHSAVRAALALSLAMGLAACGDYPNNTSLYSVREPVIERTNLALDIAAGAGGLSIPEKARLADWFDTLDLGYGDRVALDAPYASEAVREDVAALAGRHGLLLSEGAPVTAGYLDAGKVRVVVTRSKAVVPDCPDWSDGYSVTLDNATHDNFGCAVNANLAAMVADPEHLLSGATSTGDTVVMSGSKAIKVYRENPPTGKGGVASVSTSNQGN